MADSEERAIENMNSASSGTTIANVQELGDVIAKAVASALSVVLPNAIANATSGVVAPILQGIAGLDGSSSAVMFTNMTGQGVWKHQNDAMQQSLADRVGSIVNTQAKQQTISDFARALNPEDVWLAKNGYENNEAGHKAYTREINKLTNEMIDKRGVDFIYNAANEYLGLNSVGESGKYIGDMAKSLERQARRSNSLRSTVSAGIIAGNMFREADRWTEEDLYMTDADGNFLKNRNGKRIRRAGTAGYSVGDYKTDERGAILQKNVRYNAEDWGGQSQEGVAQLAAHIAETTNLMDGVDTSVPAELSKAGENIKDTVKAYANALAPLKDIFGNDMKSMIQTLEGFTGQSITQSSINRINKLASQIAARKEAGYAMNGKYGLGDRTDRMNNMIDQNKDLITNGVMRGNGAGTALFGMDLEQGAGLGFGYYTKEQWANNAQQLAFELGNSEGTENIANSFSLWQQANKGNKDADLSFAAYQAAVQKQMQESGMDMNDAIMAVAGVSNMTELRAGAAFGGAADALQSGDAAAMNLAGGLIPQMREMAKIEVANDMSLRFALDKAGYKGDPTELLDMMDTLQKEDPQLFAMTDPELRRQRMLDRSGELAAANQAITDADSVLNDKSATDEQKAAARQRKQEAEAQAEAAKQRIEGMNAMIGYMHTNQDSAIGNYGALQQHNQNQKRIREANAKADLRRSAGNKIYKAVNESGNADLIMDLIENGGSMEEIKDKIKSRGINLSGVELDAAAQIMSVADVYVKENSKDIIDKFATDYHMSTGSVKELLEDGRKRYATLSDKGKAMYDDLQSRYSQAYMTAYNGLSDPALLQSEHYVDAVEKASTSKDAKERKRNADLAMIYNRMGGKNARALDKYLSSTQINPKTGRPMEESEKINKLIEEGSDAGSWAVMANAENDLISKYTAEGDDAMKKEVAHKLMQKFYGMRDAVANGKGGKEWKGIELTGNVNDDFAQFKQRMESGKLSDTQRAVLEDMERALGENGVGEERKEGTEGNGTAEEPGKAQTDQMGKLLTVLGELSDTMKTMNTTLAGMSGESTGTRISLISF